MKWLINQIRKEEWSPYAAGILLGIVGILTVVLSQNLLGASGGFENLAAYIGKAIDPKNMYFNYVMPAGITFPVVLLVGVFFGGMLGALSSGTFKFRTMDDEQWKQAIGKQPWKRWLLLFIGAIILEYAAGIAGGCTSGLAISGGMLLVPAAFLFIVGMFASGIITALIVYGKKY
jgi:uncharacterized membrane protein YedE/YeeE